ncbi:kinase-like domain-containing protein [Crassisporium funariophilum]|nr:kinase-like domain-containing protein [Crassisporium funariophilum]
MGTLDLRVLRFLGEGTSGTVYLVKDRISRAKLALKVIPKRGRNEYSLNIVVKERNLAAKLADCPWFVNMWAAWHDQAHFYIAMTLYPTDLDSEMIRCNVIEPLRARFYMAEMIIALTELHSRGIIHRDIKAPNILIDREGHIVLADFGLSKDFHKIPTIAERVFQPYWPYLPGDKPTSETEPRDPEELHFVAWNYRGSEMEMAPEIHLRRPYSFGVDFWSIAIILFWMSTGRPPFWDEEEDYEDEGEDDVKPLMYKIAEDPLHWEETDDVDDVTMDFLEKMLAKDPRKRLTISFEMPAHPYFAGLNWSLMETRMVPPPWVPGNRINHVYEPTSATFTPGLPYSDAIEDPFPNFTFNSAQVQNRLLHPDEDESDSDDDSDANTMHGDVGDDLEDQFADVPLNRSADDERNTDSLENQDDQDARTLSANSNAVHELDVKASWDRSIINPPATRPYGPGPKSWIHGPDLLNLRSSLPTTPSAPLTLNISPHPLFRANPQASSTQRLDFKTRPCVASDDPTISSSRPQTTTHVVNGVGVMFKLKVWVWKIWNPKPKKGPQMKRLSLSS